MGGLNKAKGAKKNLAINKWRGGGYLALESNRIASIHMIRDYNEIQYYISTIISMSMVSLQIMVLINY